MNDNCYNELKRGGGDLCERAFVKLPTFATT